MTAVVLVSLAIAAPASGMAVGYNDEGSRYPIAHQALAKSGTQVARFGVFWSSIEPQRDEWDFSYTDSAVSALEAQGIRPILGISGSPGWANGATPGISCPCDRAADPDWQAMWVKVAQRYPEAVLNVWNEPNFAAYGSVSVDRMAELVNEAAAAIFSVNPTQAVLAPPMAPIPGWKGYVGSLYPKLDPRIEAAANFYPYGKVQRNFSRDLAAMRELSGSRPLWITEVNVSRLGPHPVSEQTQADFIRYAYSVAKQAGVQAMLIHRLWSPYSPDDKLLAWDSGLSALRQDGTANELFNVVRALHGRRPTRLRPIPMTQIPPVSYPFNFFVDPATTTCPG